MKLRATCPAWTTAVDVTFPRSCAGPHVRGVCRGVLIAASLRTISLTVFGFVWRLCSWPPPGGRERLAEVDERLRAVDVAAPDRDEHAEDRAEDQSADREPPAGGDARPGRLEVDLALGVRVDAALSRRSSLKAPRP